MTLRETTLDDLLVFLEHQRDPIAARMAAFAPRDRDAFMEHWRTKILGNAAVRARTILVDGSVAGNVLVWEQDAKRMVGYWLGRTYWGRGIATAALTELLRHEPARPLIAYVAAHNLGSARVLEKCGFRRVGEPTRGSGGVEELLFQLDDG